ncbi:hypothetical protein OQA88_3103 [Cercophora sp. LCS_1]
MSETDDVFDLSIEFQTLLNEAPGVLILQFIKDNWSYYRNWMNPGRSEGRGTAWETSRGRLIKSLGSIEVRCRDGSMDRLERTIFSSKENHGKMPSPAGLSVIEVPDPRDPTWRLLSHLGVAWSVTVGTLLEYLSELRSAQASLEKVSEVYSRMRCNCKAEEGLGLIRRKFDELPLIYIPSGRMGPTSAWHCGMQCVWDGGQYLRHTPSWKDYYPDLRGFFFLVVGIRKETLGTVTAELRQVTASTEIKHIASFLIAANTHLGTSQDYHTDDAEHAREEPPILTQCIFPVTSTGLNSTFVTLYSAQPRDVWFIADRHHLRQSFDRIVPLPAFSVDEVAHMPTTLRWMGLQGRLLSSQVGDVISIHGRIRLHARYTTWLRGEARFVAR